MVRRGRGGEMCADLLGKVRMQLGEGHRGRGNMAVSTVTLT